MNFAALDKTNFSDFADLMSSMQISKDCFCFSHRVEPKDIELGFPAQQHMEKLANSDLVNGIIGYQNGVANVWIGIEPAPLLIGHDFYGEHLQDEPQSTWVIHCMTTRPQTDNRKELCLEAIKKAVHLARSKGARKVIGFPVKASEHSSLSPGRRFFGNEAFFEAAGFQPQTEVGSYFRLWWLQLVLRAV